MKRACDRCAKLKIKCDFQKPCENCTNGSLSCEYTRGKSSARGPMCAPEISEAPDRQRTLVRSGETSQLPIQELDTREAPDTPFYSTAMDTLSIAPFESSSWQLYIDLLNVDYTNNLQSLPPQQSFEQHGFGGLNNTQLDFDLTTIYDFNVPFYLSNIGSSSFVAGRGKIFS